MSAPALVSRSLYGTVQHPHDQGKQAELICLRNDQGTEVSLCNWGLTLTSFTLLDKHQQATNILLHCDHLADFERQCASLNAIVGRYGNRIAEGKLPVGDQIHQVTVNLPPHHLHGGEVGFSKVLWHIRKAEIVEGVPTAILEYQAKDGEEGFPGNLFCQITVQLHHDNELRFTLTAEPDADTHVNLTHHAYFNLSGQFNQPLDQHLFKIHSQQITEVDADGIPTGELTKISQTPLDFSEFKTLDLDSQHPLMTRADGFDHNFVFKTRNSSDAQVMVEVKNPDNGICLTLTSTQPGMQFYSGQYLGGTPGPDGQIYESYRGFCLEPQHFPDTPNHSHFPTTLVRKGEKYQQVFSYHATVESD